jgi:hypothetical protein
MPTHPTQPAGQTKWLVPAWMFSVAIHCAIFAVLCAKIQPWSNGSADSQRGSMAIVLHKAVVDGTSTDDNPYNVIQTAAFVENLQPPQLLAVSNTTSATPETAAADQASNTPPQPTAKSGGTKKAPTRQSKATGSSNATASSTRARLASPGSNGYAQVSVFGVQGHGNKFIYVFDRSASMEGPPLAAAKKQLIDSLQSLSGLNQFHIIFFNTHTQSFDASAGGHRVAFASDRNKKLATNFVGGITADGGTDRLVALREAINFAPDVIFFLTDAEDPMSPTELAELARANRKAQATICVIEFGKKPEPTPNDFLARLAHDTGGQYGYVDTTKLK